MKLSFNWICDFLTFDQKIPAEKLAEIITLSICEVEHIEETGKHLSSIITAEVIAINPHPNADQLILVTVNLGNETSEQVVCGAKNLNVGNKVPFAGLGVTLPHGLTIKKAKIRGIESCGMLCAEDELGFSEDHVGVMILPDETVPGTSLAEIFPDQIDLILEIDNKSITHRPDLWGHYGFARELAAIYHQPLKALLGETFLSQIQTSHNAPINVSIQASQDLVPRFTGITLEGIKIESSPVWLQHRLFRVGLRPINNIVDLTNYVMLDIGQPMHAFDADQIAGQQLIIRPGNNDVLMTLYQKEVTLQNQDLVICDAKTSLTVAGIIGGESSGVTEKTQCIFLEAANWDPVTIRKTSARIGLRTDASQRFEKALDPVNTIYAISRFLFLLQQQQSIFKICGELVDFWRKTPETIQITINIEFILKRLGVKLLKYEIIKILQYLGFTVEGQTDTLVVTVPSFRATKDIRLPEDLVEEIGRIYGYNNIKPIAPLFPVEALKINQSRAIERQVKLFLSHQGFHEIYNYPLTNHLDEKFLNYPASTALNLINPVAENQHQMRRSLLPQLIKNVQFNQKNYHNFKLFEIGRIYEKTNLKTKEINQLGLTISQESTDFGQAFYSLKQDVQKLLVRLHLPKIKWRSFSSVQNSYQHPHVGTEIIYEDQILGSIFNLTPEFVDKYNIKGNVCFGILNLDVIYQTPKKEPIFQTPSKYPPVLFEISLIIPKKMMFYDIQQLILNINPLIVDVKFADLYFPQEMPGQKSLSLAMKFRSHEKTLTSEEVKNLQEQVIENLQQHGYQLRS